MPTPTCAALIIATSLAPSPMASTRAPSPPARTMRTSCAFCSWRQRQATTALARRATKPKSSGATAQSQSIAFSSTTRCSGRGACLANARRCAPPKPRRSPCRPGRTPVLARPCTCSLPDSAAGRKESASRFSRAPPPSSRSAAAAMATSRESSSSALCRCRSCAKRAGAEGGSNAFDLRACCSACANSAAAAVAAAMSAAGTSSRPGTVSVVSSSTPLSPPAPSPNCGTASASSGRTASVSKSAVEVCAVEAGSRWQAAAMFLAVPTLSPVSIHTLTPALERSRSVSGTPTCNSSSTAEPPCSNSPFSISA
mmetsp:Transcript_22977/g.54413  ORF Transcript_22977/g.54413 Transcript_22977/m.54413 type:complete len:312 (+) Transcript_22977:429-1364(+)